MLKKKKKHIKQKQEPYYGSWQKIFVRQYSVCSPRVFPRPSPANNRAPENEWPWVTQVLIRFGTLVHDGEPTD